MDKYFQNLIIKNEDVELLNKKIEIIQNSISEFEFIKNKLIQIAENEKSNSERLNIIINSLH